MKLLDELYDLKSNEPLHITLEKLVEAEYDLDKQIKELNGQVGTESMSSYLKRKQMLKNLKLELDYIN